MESTYLSAKEAARYLGVTVTTLYDWLGQSDFGLLMIQEQSFTIDYFQSGRRGQGRIQIAKQEVVRLKDSMRVRPKRLRKRRSPTKQQHYPGITATLGRPDATD